MAPPDDNPRLTPELERTLRRFVLGALDESVRTELEERLVTEPDVFEALGVVEDELVEHYLDGALPAPERQSFERHFLSSPGRVARLRFARSLRARASRAAAEAHAPAHGGPGSAASPRWEPALLALAAALVLSLAANVWLATRPAPSGPAVLGPAPAPTPDAQEARSAATRAAASDPELAASLDRERDARTKAESRVAALEEALRHARPAVAAFALAAGGLRAGGTLREVRVPAETPVQLRLELSGRDYFRYRAVLLDGSGGELWAASRLEAREEAGELFVPLSLPPGALKRGDYLVKLSGLDEQAREEAVSAYPFRVVGP